MQDGRMDGWCFQHGRCSVSLACRCCMCLEAHYAPGERTEATRLRTRRLDHMCSVAPGAHL